MNISEDFEKLCEVVRDYPILYDKSQKGYKERDAVENAWNEVSSNERNTPGLALILEAVSKKRQAPLVFYKFGAPKTSFSFF